MNKKQQVIFLWNGGPKNFVKVCLQSLREYNKDCTINFFYNNFFTKLTYKKYNINFIKINNKLLRKGTMFYKIKIVKDFSEKLENDTELLILDLDLLFQDDPFKMFKDNKNNDIYYSCCLMSKPESLRPEKIWKGVDYKVNGGVWGIKISSNIIAFMNFWVDNLQNPVWEEWKNYKYRKDHLNNGKVNLKWWCDQDFLNCIEQSDRICSMFDLRKIDVGYKYNYFTSTWGYFNEELSMRNKIGNKDYKIMHFKGNFQDTFNLNNNRIYNYKNILAKKDLTTNRSRERIYKLFLSRGPKRFEII